MKPLTLLINQVLNTGSFPDKLKIAKVVPIFKKGDPSLVKNYRPISLLPAISIVGLLEKIIALQLSSYFEKNKRLFDNQYGFRPKHSTEHAALELINIIINKMDTNEIPLNNIYRSSKGFRHHLSCHSIKQIEILWTERFDLKFIPKLSK